MIISMTGMARHSISGEGYVVTCEFRSLNGKYLDLNIKLPRSAGMCEEIIRSLIKTRCRRGRIDVYINIEPVDKMRPLPRLDVRAFRAYWNELNLLSRLVPNLDPPTLRDVLSIPYIFDTSSAVDPDKQSEEEARLCELIAKACEEGLEKLSEMRLREGKLLEAECLKHLATIERLLDEVESRKDDMVIAVRDRIRERVERLLSDLSPGINDHLILQEVAIIADRTDISEELSRLRAHVVHFRTLALSPKEAADGKQLDFMVQEMHREANTMGAKSQDLAVSEIIVLLKTEIAKLREQVQNIE